MTEEITSETEEFLESIYRLQERNGAARTSNLVKMLKVAPGTITNTVERLEKRGLVTHETYRGVKLTPKGRGIALSVLRRHRLSERLLTDILRMEWNQVHEEACRLEHGLTDEIAANIENVLKGPQTCPHGNPIPTTFGGIIEEPLKLLSQINPGEEGVVTGVTDEKPSVLKQVERLSLKPGAFFRVLSNTFPYGPVTVGIGESKHEIDPKIAAVVKVKTKPADSGNRGEKYGKQLS